MNKTQMKTPELTNSELHNLHQGLYNCSNVEGKKFSYAVLKNRDKIDRYFEKFNKEHLAEFKEYTKYDNERVKLAEKMADKDENGKPKSINGKYVFKDEKAFKEKVKEIKDKHKEAIKTREKQLNNYEKLLKKKANIELHMILDSEIPDSITPNQLAGIKQLIAK